MVQTFQARGGGECSSSSLAGKPKHVHLHACGDQGHDRVHVLRDAGCRVQGDGNREKAAKWADQGVELFEGDWNDVTAIAAALIGVAGAFVMLLAVWAPSPDFKETKGVIANYVEALIKAAPPRMVALSSMGANRTSGLGMISADEVAEQWGEVLKLNVKAFAIPHAGWAGAFEQFGVPNWSCRRDV